MRRLFATFALVLALVAMQAPPALARYVLDYGDGLQITVTGAPQYNFGGTVRPDGVITAPVFGDIDVRGLSTDQVRDRYRELVGRVLRDPIVTVAVTTYKPRTVTVLGEVTRPGSVEVTRADMTVLDALAAAGGFTDHAIPKEVVVLRGNGAATRVLPADVETMLRTGDLATNVRLEPGDRIQVPRSNWPTWQESLNFLRDMSLIAGTVVVLVNLLGRAGTAAGI